MLYLLVFYISFVSIWFIIYASFLFSFQRVFTYFFFFFLILFSFYFFLFYNKSIFWYHSIFYFYNFFFLNLNYIFAFDIISISLVFLSVILLYLCFFIYWFLTYKLTFYSMLLLISLLILINVFLSLDFFFFYIFFESIIIPMYFIIGIWGSRSRKIYAAYQFFIYTLLGSLFVLLCLFSIFLNKGSTFMDFFIFSFFHLKRYYFFWFILFFGFSVKIPIIPLHIWLPEAHVEAPTPGSVLLAGILLKLGSYAILKLLIISSPYAVFPTMNIVLVIAIIGLFYASFVALNQIDIKKIIAYSSVAHMNFSLIGLFSYFIFGLLGAFYMMLGHAFTSGALFLSLGVLYDRYKTRCLFYYSALSYFMPIFSIYFLIFILSNFGFPGTINFAGEFLILVGGTYVSSFVIFVSAFALIFALIYSLVFFTKAFFGPFISTIIFFVDLSRLEWFILSILLFIIIIGGFLVNNYIDLVWFRILFFIKGWV